MGGRLGDELLRLPVRMNGIQLGRPVDLILDLASGRAVGLDVLCGDEVHRFLPLAGAKVRDDELAVGSALMLLDDLELSFYRERGNPLRALRGAPVERRGETLGSLADVEVDPEGVLVAYVLAERGERVEVADGVRLGDTRRRIPAA
jgi:uncharacterized protein YrrD